MVTHTFLFPELQSYTYLSPCHHLSRIFLCNPCSSKPQCRASTRTPSPCFTLPGTPYTIKGGLSWGGVGGGYHVDVVLSVSDTYPRWPRRSREKGSVYHLPIHVVGVGFFQCDWSLSPVVHWVTLVVAKVDSPLPEVVHHSSSRYSWSTS